MTTTKKDREKIIMGLTSGSSKIGKKKKSRFPGDFETYMKSEERKESRKKAKEKYEKDKQHPVLGKHAAFDRLVDAGKVEQKAYKEYRKNRANVREKARSNNKKYGTTNL